MRLLPWLRLFRVVNLPTVPGDVLVGASVAMSAGGCAGASAHDLRSIALAAVGSCFLYMFGLADNDIVGAASDRGRPIPDGEVSMQSAKVARYACLALGLLAVPARGAVAALALVAVIVAYNRTKLPALMGLCRGLNVVVGVLAAVSPIAVCAVSAAVAAWTGYIAAVTQYSEGEERDQAKRRRVGLLVGGIVYLQLAALGACALANHGLWPFFAAGIALLVVHKVFLRLFPKVSAS